MLFRSGKPCAVCSRFARLSPSLVKYYQDYRYSLVRCAVEACDFRGDFEALGKFLDPPLAPALAKKYAQDLLEWGLISKGEDGRFQIGRASCRERV